MGPEQTLRRDTLTDRLQFSVRVSFIFEKARSLYGPVQITTSRHINERKVQNAEQKPGRQMGPEQTLRHETLTDRRSPNGSRTNITA